MSRTRAEMIEETRVKLLAAARKAFRDSGYAAASMDELTAAAGLTRGALPSLRRQAGTAGCGGRRTRPGNGPEAAAHLGRGARRLDGAARTLPRLAAHGDRTRNPAHRATGRARAVLGPASEPAQQPCITSLATLLQSLMDEGQVRAAEPQALARLINGALMDGAFWIAAAPDDGERLEQLRALDLLLDGCANAEASSASAGHKDAWSGWRGALHARPRETPRRHRPCRPGRSLLFKDNSCLNTPSPQRQEHTVNSDTAQASGASWADLLHGANALRSIALAGGVALHAINVYIVTTILPSIIKRHRRPGVLRLEHHAVRGDLHRRFGPIGAADPGMGSQGGVPAGRGRLLGRLGRLCARALHALDAGGPQHPGTGRRRAVRAELCADPHRVRRGAVVARDGAGVRHVGWRRCAARPSAASSPRRGTGAWRSGRCCPPARCWPSSWRPRWAASRR